MDSWKIKEILTKDLDINPRIREAAVKGGFSNAWKILETQISVLKTRTKLKENEIERLVACAAKNCCPNFVNVLDSFKNLQSSQDEFCSIKFGCSVLDSILGGGIPLGKITEIVGESSSGKTQLALTLALQAQLKTTEGGIEKNVAYICTEGQFPFVRLNQMLEKRTHLESHNKKTFSDNIFVHHVPDMKDLVNCASYQLPNFIQNNNVGIIIIDSIAAVFRADEGVQVEKCNNIRKLGYKLHDLATQLNVAIVAINQVSASFSSSMYGLLDEVTPALGLSWANFVTMRCMLRKCSFSVTRTSDITNNASEYEAKIRSLEVVFCAWLPRKTAYFIITQKGIESIDPLSNDLNFV